MQRGAAGRYESVRAGGETVRAFLPDPLPPMPPLIMDGARQALLERSLLALGRLDAISALLPDPRLLLYAYVRKEAVLSSQIEGTLSSLSDLLLFELDAAPGVPIDDVVEVSNYVAALEHGIARIRGGFPLSGRLLREMHAHLLSRGRGSDKLPGEFRRSQNWIGGTRPGNAHYVPPPPYAVPDAVGALETFLHDERQSFPVLIKSALAHVQFETIHPFLDGNGRLGRLLITVMLVDAGLLTHPLLYLSLYFKQHRAEYYRLLDGVRSEGDWEAWLDFFLVGVQVTATGAVATAERLVRLFAEDFERVRQRGSTAASALRVLAALRERPIISLGAVCSASGMSFPTASKGMQLLLQLGVVRELTGFRRNRLFAYERYLGVLNEGMEPL